MSLAHSANSIVAFKVVRSKSSAAIERNVELSGLCGAWAILDLKILNPLLGTAGDSCNLWAAQKNLSPVASVVGDDVQNGIAVNLAFDNDV